MELFVLSEGRDEPGASPSAQDMIDMTRAAQLVGCRVFFIPKDFSACETADNALWQIEAQVEPTPAVWLGFIPSPERYEAILHAARERNVHLLNTVEEHLRALEFDRALPLLGGLTPASVVLHEGSTPKEWHEATRSLGFPLFVRGTARSRKAAGWKACVADTKEELEALVAEMFSLPYRARGRVIVRQIVPLRHSRTSDQGFPLGREFRLFLMGARVLGCGYYWEGDDPLRDLTPDEEREVFALAREAARRVGAPFVAVDVGQMEGGAWTVIEVGDAQFAATGQMSRLPLWNALREEVGAVAS